MKNLKNKTDIYAKYDQMWPIKLSFQLYVYHSNFLFPL